MLRALTVRQPHAGLIVVDGKVENRSSLTNERGEYAIHAGKTPDLDAMARVRESGKQGPFSVLGAVLAVADLVDCHRAIQSRDDGTTCCEPYGLRTWNHKPAFHLAFANVCQLPRPVPCRGQLWIGWRLPDEIETQVRQQLSELEVMP
jgi:hypothetical protein